MIQQRGVHITEVRRQTIAKDEDLPKISPI